METFPPSYEHAVARDAWAIVAPYVQSPDLHSVCLVSKRWHEIFVPFLWGAPASHFMHDNDALHDALIRFRRTLRLARRWVRELTHTIHLLPVVSELYDGPKTTWLLEVLELLPALQSLIVSRYPYFDHSSLMTVDSKICDATSGVPVSLRTYGLRLLLADYEPNVTPIGLRRALLHFPGLIYLDLSYTMSAKDCELLSALSRLSDLQILKLRGIQMKDSEMRALVEAIGLRVRLLDVRDNLLTDVASELLVQKCLPSATHDTRPEQANYAFEWRLPNADFGNVLTPESLVCEHLGEHFIRQLTMPLDGQSSIADIPHVGITHLYISGNQLSPGGFSSLLESGNLCILDAGTTKDRRQGPNIRHENIPLGAFDGMETLPSMLRQPMTNNLTYLRIHYTVLTGRQQAQEGARKSPRGRKYLQCQELKIEASASSSTPLSQSNRRTNLIRHLISKRPEMSALSQSHDECLLPILHPSSLPKLQTLVLTDVPSQVPVTSPVLETLTDYITACADETVLASLQAQSDYSLPPGWHRARAEQQRAKSLFALERIILEISPVANPRQPAAWTSECGFGPGYLKSSTEDRDSENLWEAAVDDFSFFNQDDIEMPIFSKEKPLFSSGRTLEPNGLASGPRSPSADTQTTAQIMIQDEGSVHEPSIDLVAALASFRKKKREEFTTLLRQEQGRKLDPAGIPIHVEGHWTGEVKIVKG